ncbi:RNA polymerase ECF-type sigma factor [Indibacter alkaliphilus LW1]|uniref:RNA polymerase ECF-type sigma factor n=1 Tax=Indibacter alkaliphilus (strain CCUG 57479 / KCTC 22604 / LW1) TaxID=1189612 RepID=S2CYE2_INDAL|nr:sigma-70 family RNA polymerase sigma factor [Indibacter alkaliphilus]EOZ91584.1 RNA polymerase ECF-type sigma factor [Indibacter alkaliphilus LW1]
MKTDTDSHLLFKIKKGDSKAFDSLFYKYWDPLFSAAFTRLKSQDLAKDVVQDVFIDLWKRKESLEIKRSLEVYLFTAVKYGVFKALDSSREYEELQERQRVDTFSSDSILELDELYSIIESKLDLLPISSAEIFRMYKYKGLTAVEIAGLKGMAPQSVHNSIQKTLNFLRSELKEYSPLIIFAILNIKA